MLKSSNDLITIVVKSLRVADGDDSVAVVWRTCLKEIDAMLCHIGDLCIDDRRFPVVALAVEGSDFSFANRGTLENECIMQAANNELLRDDPNFQMGRFVRDEIATLECDCSMPYFGQPAPRAGEQVRDQLVKVDCAGIWLRAIRFGDNIELSSYQLSREDLMAYRAQLQELVTRA